MRTQDYLRKSIKGYKRIIKSIEQKIRNADAERRSDFWKIKINKILEKRKLRLEDLKRRLAKLA